MANRMYTEAVHAMLRGELDLENDTIVAYLVNVSGSGTTYTPDLDGDEFLDDIPEDALIAGPIELTNKEVADRGFTSDGVTFPNVSEESPSVEALVIVREGSDASDSLLLFYIDTATGLPAEPAGGNIPVSWPSGILSITNPS